MSTWQCYTVFFCCGIQLLPQYNDEFANGVTRLAVYPRCCNAQKGRWVNRASRYLRHPSLSEEKEPYFHDHHHPATYAFRPDCSKEQPQAGWWTSQANQLREKLAASKKAGSVARVQQEVGEWGGGAGHEGEEYMSVTWTLFTARFLTEDYSLQK